MKRVKASFLFPLIGMILLLSINNSHGQNPRIASKKDSLHKHTLNINIGIGTSPTHTLAYNYYTAPTGLYCSLKFGSGKATEISTGLYYDFKKYSDTNNIYAPFITPSITTFTYHYLYIPFLMHIYIIKPYLSFGFIIRKPIGIPSADKYIQLPNPSFGFQVGFGDVIHFNNSKFNLNINPYLIFLGHDETYYGVTSSNYGTLSSGILIGINLDFSYRIYFPKGFEFY